MVAADELRLAAQQFDEKHTVKPAFTWNAISRSGPAGGGYSGNYNFQPDANIGVNNTGDGYANGLLGYVQSYSQQTARAVFNDLYWNAEFYVKDSRAARTKSDAERRRPRGTRGEDVLSSAHS